MATRWRSLHKRAKRNQVPRCEDCGERSPLGCQTYLEQRAPDHWLCVEHAEARGYCIACGGFAAHDERFSFGPRKGYCESCGDEIMTDLETELEYW